MCARFTRNHTTSLQTRRRCCHSLSKSRLHFTATGTAVQQCKCTFNFNCTHRDSQEALGTDSNTAFRKLLSPRKHALRDRSRSPVLRRCRVFRARSSLYPNGTVKYARDGTCGWKHHKWHPRVCSAQREQVYVSAHQALIYNARHTLNHTQTPTSTRHRPVPVGRGGGLVGHQRHRAQRVYHGLWQPVLRGLEAVPQ